MNDLNKTIQGLDKSVQEMLQNLMKQRKSF